MITALLGMLLLSFALLVWSGWVEPRKVIVKKFEVGIEGLKSPLTAVVVGDIQPNSYHWPKERLEALFGQLNEEHSPDLVFWLGDYYNAPTDLSLEFLSKRPEMDAWIAARMPSMEEIASAMTMLPGRLGTFAVLGNHDWAWSGHETREHLTAIGIRVLQDEVVEVTDPSLVQSLQIVGYEDLSSGRTPSYQRLHADLREGSATIGLSHSPDAFPAAEGGPSLMLSGHTHGGQVRLPFLGALILPVKYPEYDMGWFSRDSRRLFVTAGLGTSLPPLRLLCPPEVVVLTLKPAET